MLNTSEINQNKTKITIYKKLYPQHFKNKNKIIHKNKTKVSHMCNPVYFGGGNILLYKYEG